MKNLDNYDTRWHQLIKRQLKEKMLFELEYFYNNNYEIIDFERIINSLKSVDILDEHEYKNIYDECINFIIKD